MPEIYFKITKNKFVDIFLLIFIDIYVYIGNLKRRLNRNILKNLALEDISI